jgi:HPt (histidine-containing phosphotransfer) domain-containing protein
MSEITKDLTAEALDQEQINLLLSLDDGGGAVLAEIIGEFLATSDVLRLQLVNALGNDDLAAARAAAHTLKGASANVGATSLADVCAQLESRLGVGETDEAVGLSKFFEAEFARACEVLRNLIGEV